MAVTSFVTRTSEGTITISIVISDGKSNVRLYDSYNGFDCICDVDHLIELKKFFKNMSKMEGEKKSFEYMERINGEQTSKWFYGNYIQCCRAASYIKALEDVSRPVIHKVGGLKRMSTKNLMELYKQNNVRKVILQEKKGR